MHPKYLSIADFAYDLPKEKIALHPASPRDHSKLLIYRDGKIEQDTYNHIAQYLPQHSMLIFNDTRVIKARILFQKPTGATIEIFCLEPFEESKDFEVILKKQNQIQWKCLIGGAGKWKAHSLIRELQIGNEKVVLNAQLTQKLPDAYVVEFSWTPGHFSFAEILESAGVIPLPPYIKREVESEDSETYQTIYSAHDGSVAAPTAGLHFTDGIFKSLKENNIDSCFVTLHVGAGTFKPVKSEKMEGHHMHAEWMDISVDLLESLLSKCDNKLICVGTTSLRTIESMYWMGCKILNQRSISIGDLMVKQWEPYEAPLAQTKFSKKESLQVLLDYTRENCHDRLLIPTELIIAPEYRLRIADGLVTNFHQPHSTLLLLVAAVAGKDWKKIYDYALKHEFRFLSYGDGCLIVKQDDNC